MKSVYKKLSSLILLYYFIKKVNIMTRKSTNKKSPCKKINDNGEVIEELRNRIKYLQADFENYKKQIDKEKAEFQKNANEKLINDLLQILDDLERSIPEIKDNKTRTGISMVLSNMKKVLECNGLKQIEALGKKFDSCYHDAVIAEKSEQEEGTILQELERGYLLNSIVIRHSKVKISKK